MSASQTTMLESSPGTSGVTMAEGIAGIATIVLTILGLADVAPLFLVAIATITAGIAVLAQAATTGASYVRVMTAQGYPIAAVGGGGWSIELFAGGAGVVLGVLALLHVHPVALVAIGLIALGGGLVLSSGATAQTVIFRVATVDDRVRRVMVEAASSTGMTQALVGLAGIVLGILSLAGFASVPLVLIGLLTIGIYFVISGSSAGGLLVSIFRA